MCDIPTVIPTENVSMYFITGQEKHKINTYLYRCSVIPNIFNFSVSIERSMIQIFIRCIYSRPPAYTQKKKKNKNKMEDKFVCVFYKEKNIKKIVPRSFCNIKDIKRFQPSKVYKILFKDNDAAHPVEENGHILNYFGMNFLYFFLFSFFSEFLISSV